MSKGVECWFKRHGSHSAGMDHGVPWLTWVKGKKGPQERKRQDQEVKWPFQDRK